MLLDRDTFTLPSPLHIDVCYARHDLAYYQHDGELEMKRMHAEVAELYGRDAHDAFFPELYVMDSPSFLLVLRSRFDLHVLMRYAFYAARTVMIGGWWSLYPEPHGYYHAYGRTLAVLNNWSFTTLHREHHEWLLQHELGHAFGLPHTEEYGIPQKEDSPVNCSIMSYNERMTVPAAAGGKAGVLMARELRLLSKQLHAFPHLYSDDNDLALLQERFPEWKVTM